MYSAAFCKVYNEFGWNYFPSAFGEQLLQWLDRRGAKIGTSLDLACGTGVLCELLQDRGIQASGMDLAAGMIDIAHGRDSRICYEVGDMVAYRPERTFDLVTCTGDALNHIFDLRDVEQIFRNVYSYLNEGGYFVFDILNEHAISPGEPMDLDYSDTVKAQLTVTRGVDGVVDLSTRVYEKGVLQFEEHIREIVHDPEVICSMLRRCGFRVVQCADRLLEGDGASGEAWYIVATK